MVKQKLSISAINKALSSLERAISQPKNEFSRDSVIQRFEYTFELCWKTLLKVLEFDKPLDDRGVRSILREAAQRGLISDLDLWFKFQESRNLTSHTYNEDVAEEVYQNALQLPKKTHELIQQILKQIKE